MQYACTEGHPRQTDQIRITPLVDVQNMVNAHIALRDCHTPRVVMSYRLGCQPEYEMT